MESEKQNKPSILKIFGVGLVIFIVFFCFVIWVVKDLWNYTVPDIFHLKEITYFEAMRLTLLIHILLGSAKIWSSTKKH
jgi:hypothetical protein